MTSLLWFVTSLLAIGTLHVSFTRAQSEPYINNIQTRTVGINGEIRVVIEGGNFPSDQMSLSTTAPRRVEATFVADNYATVQCVTSTDEVRPGIVICYAGALKDGVIYQLRMTIDGVPIPQDRLCSRNSNWCSLKGDFPNTPFCNSIREQSVVSGDLVELDCKIFTELFELLGDENDRHIRRVYVAGSRNCALKDDTTGEVYKLERWNDGSSNWGTLQCKPTIGNYIGNSNFSLIVSHQHGRSITDAPVKRVSGNQDIYTFQFHARVTDIGVHSGSVGGGTRLAIQMKHAMGNDVVVTVGADGHECSIVAGSVTEEGFQCDTPPDPKLTQTIYPGGAGALLEIWPPQDGGTNPHPFNRHEEVLHWTADMPGYTSKLLPAFGVDPDNDLGTYFTMRVSGYFVPPHDGEYEFHVMGDDSASLYLSSNGTKEGLELIGETSSYTYMKPLKFEEQNSGGLLLQGGKPYYLVAVGSQYRAGSLVHVGLLDKQGRYTSSVVSAWDEMQKITTTSTVIRERQVISKSPSGGLSDTSEVQVATVTSSAGGEFRFKVFSAHTSILPYNANGGTVKDALNAVMTIYGHTGGVTSVDMTSQGGASVYTVTFKSLLGDIPQLDATQEGEVPVTVTVTTSAQGSPSSSASMFVLWQGGVPTPPIDTSATAEQVEAALEMTYAGRCPSDLAALATRSSYQVAYHADFEDASAADAAFIYDDNVTALDALCGFRALRNSPVMFREDRRNLGVIDMETYKHVCFAYKGEFESKLLVVYEVQYWWRIQEVELPIAINVENDNEWKYTCVNVYEPVLVHKNAIYGESQQTIGLRSVALKRPLGTISTYYYDHVSVVRNPPLQDMAVEPDAAKRVAAPANSHGDWLLAASVNETDTDYIVELVPRNCFSAAVELLQSSMGNAVSRAQATSGPVRGTFDVTVVTDQGPQTMTGLPADVEARDLKLQLESLGTGALAVMREGTCEGYTWTVEWTGSGGNKEPTQVTSHLTGNDVTLEASTFNDGGNYYPKIVGEFSRTPASTPQVMVSVNGLPSYCDNSCSFEWRQDVTPQVTSIDPTQGPSGTAVTVSGTLLDAASDAMFETRVVIGGMECDVTSSTANSIQCTVMDSPIGSQVVEVFVGGVGKAAGGPLQFQVQGGVSNIDPTTGNVRGGNIVTLTGTGFADSVMVTLAGLECPVIAVTPTTVTCQVPPQVGGASNPAAVMVTLGAEMFSVNSMVYTYNNDPIPLITTLSTNQASSAGGETLTISGSTLGVSQPAAAYLKIGDVDVPISSWSDTELLADLPMHAPGTVRLVLSLDGENAVIPDTGVNLDITFVFHVDSISPSYGSLYGGTKLTITGEGFSSNTYHYDVTVGMTPCVVTSATPTLLHCDMESSAETKIVTNNGQDPVRGVGFQWDQDVVRIRTGDSVIWNWNVPTFVNDLEHSIGMGIYQTTDASRQTRAGFSSGDPTPSGQYHRRFNQPGTYYITSGLISSTSDHQLFGTVIVSARISEAVMVSVKMGDLEATYSSGGTAPADSSGCAPVAAPLAGCTDIKPSGNSSDYHWHSFWTCATPTLSSISANQGDATEDITVTGSGFSASDCANSIFIGNTSGSVTSSSESSISFRINPAESLSPGLQHLVEVNIKNLGFAFGDLADPMDQYFGYVHHVDSVQPSAGSISGGTQFTITGAGFVEPLTVQFGDNPTKVLAVNYTEIQGVTYPMSAETLDQAVKVTLQGGLESHCDSGSCTFSFSSASTPMVLSASTSSSSSPWEWTIDGSNLGTTMADVRVRLGTEECTVTAVADDAITCSLAHGVVGQQALTVSVAGRGDAEVSEVSPVTITPHIAGITPLISGSNGGMAMVIQGGGFLVNDTAVTISGVDCPIMTFALSELTCTVPPGPIPGSVDIVIISNGVTFPANTFTYDDALTPVVTSITPLEGNIGTTLTITGEKFSPTLSENVITLEGRDCALTLAMSTQLQCTLPVLPSGTHNVKALVSNAGEATVSTGNVFTAILSLESVTPTEGSLGGGTTLTLSGAGFSDDTMVTICDAPCEILGTPSGSSLECLTPVMTGNTDITCDVTLTSLGGTASLAEAYHYRNSLTPTVTSVMPRRGGTGGGTSLTISGADFGASQAASTVTIDSVDCSVNTWSDTQVVCTTGAIPNTTEAMVKVNVENKGDALAEGMTFYYIDRWSSTFTWGNLPPPTEGDLVVIESGHTILLDVDTPVLTLLLIKGGTLIFDEDQASITLRSHYILITHGGRLQVGTEENPYTSRATIELHGQMLAPELPLFGAKVIGLYEGTLDLHGKPIEHTWTLLAATAEPGDTSINVMNDVSDWEVGGEIVLATTGGVTSQAETEVRTIASISGTTITFTEPLEYTHLGIARTIEGHMFDFRGEVGYLSRNVKVIGALDQQFIETIEACPDGFDPGEFATQTCFQGRFGQEEGSDEFGVQIFMTVSPGGTSIGRLSYVEVTNAGQAFRLARYAVHFHLLGNVTGMSFIRGSSIHRSFNRAVNVHATQGLLVQDCVLYNIKGGAMFLEDGVEVNNIFRSNLLVFVRSSSSLLNDDITPAGWWMTNPNNIVEGNHVAGGTHFGFWYRLHSHSDGPSYDKDICPLNYPMGSFRDNVAHSLGWFGMWIFESWHPTQEAVCKQGTPAPAVLFNFTAWNVGKCAESVHGANIQMINLWCANAEKSGYELKFNDDADNLRITGQGSSLENSLIVGQVPELDVDPARPNMGAGYKGLKLPFDGGLVVKDTTLVNMPRAVAYTEIDGTCSHDCAGRIVQFTGFQTRDITASVTGWRWENEGLLHDADGSITGRTNSYVLPWVEGLPLSECEKVPADSLLNGDVPAAICSSSIGFARFSFNTFQPSSQQYKDFVLTNEHGPIMSLYRDKRVNHAEGYGIVLVTEKTYEMSFNDSQGGAMPNFANMSWNGKMYDMKEGDWMVFRAPMESLPDYAVVGGRRTDSPVGSIGPSNSHGDWNFDPYDKKFEWIIKSGPSAAARKKRALPYALYTVDASMAVVHCFYPDCVVPDVVTGPPPIEERPDHYLPWDDWPDKPTQANQDMVVPEGQHILLDISNPPPFGNIYLFGTLEIEDMDNVISAKNIFIARGRLVIGYPAAPFSHSLTLKLMGTAIEPDFVPDGFDGPTLGSKGIFNAGGLELHGSPKTPTWSNLDATVDAGANSITVVDATNWAVGDEIAIAPSYYSALESEVRTIISVSNGGRTFTLDTPLDYKHLGEEYTVGQRQLNYRTEVGVLTRAITIEGGYYENQEGDSFGGRVLTSTMFSDDGVAAAGYVRAYQTRFLRMGQMGYTRPYDCRAALTVYAMMGNSPETPLIVSGCSFQDSYSPAICLTDAPGVAVEDNVIHRTVGSAVMINSEGAVVERNLVMLVVYPGAYQDRFEVTNVAFVAGMELQDSSGTALRGNVVAGSERAGYRLGNRACPSTDGPEDSDPWADNIARGTLVGVLLLPEDATGGSCVYVANFDVYKATAWGLYLQATPGITIFNCLVSDCDVGIFTHVNKPDPLLHMREDKLVQIAQSAIIGRSDAFDCVRDVLDETDDSIKIAKMAHFWGENGDLDGVGMYFPNSASKDNEPLTMGFPGTMGYPTVSGGTRVTDTLFGKFTDKCPGKRVVAITPDMVNGDLHFPVVMTGCSTVDVPPANLVFYHDSVVGFVNPSDCVDMSCDGMKKLLIEDTDGGLLGQPGSVVSNSEAHWEQDPRYGEGYYRIPAVALLDADGIRMDPTMWTPGIIRDGTCSLESAWNAYHCPAGLDFRMVILESMDLDTETRRLSPIAVISDSGYVDLLNGPMDHGWCAGYTCQKRISTFPMLVATDNVYKIYMSGTSPQHLRIHLLWADAEDAVGLLLYYSSASRLDVYVQEVRVDPLNMDPNNPDLLLEETDDEFNLDLQNGMSGDHFRDLSLNLLRVLVRGSNIVDIKTSPLLTISFSLPPTTVDDFFGENIVTNLAAFLGLSPDKIRVTNIVQEGSSRKKRATDTVITGFDIEISSPPGEVLNTEADETNREELITASATLVQSVQSGDISDTLEVEVLGAIISEPEPAPGTEGWADYAANNGSSSQPILIPHELMLTNAGVPRHESAAFEEPIVLTVVDASGTVVSLLRSTAMPWEITATLRAGSGTDQRATLLGNTTIPFRQGNAIFSTLSISHSGSGYMIDFMVTDPTSASNFTAEAGPFTIATRELDMSVRNASDHVEVNQNLTVLAQVIDAVTLMDAEDIYWKDHVWQVGVAVASGYGYSGDLQVDLQEVVISGDGHITIPGVILDRVGRAYLEVTLTSTPADYTLSGLSTAVEVHGEGYWARQVVVQRTKRVNVIFEGDHAAMLAAGHQQQLLSKFHNGMAPRIPDVSMNEPSTSAGSIVITFDLEGMTADLETAAEVIWAEISSSYTIAVGGVDYTSTGDMTVDGAVYQSKLVVESADGGLSTGVLVAIGCVALIAVALVVVLLVWLLVLRPKTKTSPGDSPRDLEKKEAPKEILEDIE